MTNEPIKRTRPYWFNDANIENGVMLGFTSGEWPIQAFSADGSHAASWAAQDPGRRILIGPIKVPDDAPVLRGRVIPERPVLVDDDGNEVSL